MKFSTTRLVVVLISALCLMLSQSEHSLPLAVDIPPSQEWNASNTDAPFSEANSSKKTASKPTTQPVIPYTVEGYNRASLFANQLFFVPVITATKTDALVTDNAPTGANPGDVIEYTVEIDNTGNMDATGVSFSDQIDANTTLVAGSVNASPIGFDDAYTCLGNVGINVPVGSGLLINDIDPIGGSPLTVTAVNTTGTQGTVNFMADGSFTFMPSPGFEGATTFTYTVSDGLLTDETTVTITVNEVIWFVDNNAGVNGDGRLGTPFNSLANFNSGAADETNDIIFLYRNTATNYTGPLTLLNDQDLIGAGAPTSIVAITGITVPPHSNTLPATGGANNPVIAHNATNLTLAQNNKLHGFDLSNTGGTALIGNGLGTLQVRDVTVVNTSGTAIDLNSGVLDAIFPGVSASGATGTNYGIDVTNTTGSIEIQGGTISNIQQRGANFNSATNVTLKNMDFNSANTADAGGAGICEVLTTLSCHAALYFTNITTLVLNDVDVNTTEEQGLNGDNISAMTMTDCDFTNCGDDQYEGCVKIRNLHGTCSITNSTFNDAAEELVEIFNTTTPNALSLTVTGCTFSDTFDNPVGAKGIFVTTSNNTTNNVSIDDCDFFRIRTQGVNLRASAGTMNADVTDCTFSKDTKKFMAGVEIISQGTATMNINVLRNNITAAGGSAILVQGNDNSFFNARVNNNIIVGPATCSLCTADNTMTAAEDVNCNCTGDGIVVWATVNSSGKAHVSNNTISGIDLSGRGIYANARNDADLNILISGNNVATSSDNDAFYNIDITTGAGSGDLGTSFLCANVTGNTVSGNSQFTNFRARTTHATSTLQLQGPAGTIANLWNMNGNMQPTPTTSVSASATAGSTLTIGGPTCSTTLPHPSAIVSEPVEALVSNEVEINEATETPETPTPPTTKGKGNNNGAIEKSGETVTIPAFTLPTGKDVTIKFRVTIDPAPHTTLDCQISNQGMVSGSNFTTVMTDDPSTGTAGDATLTPLVPPTAAFMGTPLTGCVPLQVSFTDASTSSGGTITAWAWDIDNNGSTDYTTQNPMHTYTVPGMYTVKLTVTDDLGCTDTEIKTNYVNVAEPEVNIAVAPTSVAENSNIAMVFTVTRTGSTDCELTIPFTITGTAVEGTDYPDVVPTSFTIPAGMTTAMLSITPTGDNIVEPNETIIITLTDGASYSVGANNSATGTIANDDAAAITIADIAVQEDGTFQFTAILNNPTSTGFSVDWSLTNGSTIAADFSGATSGTLVFAGTANEPQTFTVPVLDDAIVEIDEVFTVSLSNFVTTGGFTVNITDTGEGTIIDNDAATISFTAVPSEDEGDAGMSGFNFEVTLSAVVDDAVTVTFTTMDGTATIANSDYQTNTNTITFPANGAGQTQTITIQVNGDTDSEQDETFKVMLSNIVAGGRDVTFSGGGATLSGTGTILNDDQPPVVINEVDADSPGSDVAEFIELYDGGTGNTPLDGLVVVLFNGSDDLSYRAIDLDGFFTDANGYFVIGNAGVSGVDITFPDGTLQNGADAVALYMANAANFTNGTAITTTNLLDAIVYDTDGTGDDAGLLVLLNAAQPQVDEDANSSPTCHSMQRIPNGSGGARNTTTYIAIPPTPGEANAVPEVTISVSADVAEDGATNLTYTVTRTGSTCSALSVPFTVTGTADGSDYSINVTSPITIPAGMSSATITVDPTTDATVEPNETVIITLTDASASNAYNLGTPAAATGTITNDDATTVVSIVRADPNPTNAASVDWTVTFSSPMTGVSASNFTLVSGGSVAGASITNVMGSGTTWTVTASTGTGDGTLGLDMTNSTGATDAAGNGPTNLSFAGEVYNIDKTAPTVTINQAAGQVDPTNTSPILFTVQFSEPVTDFDDLSDVTLSGTAGATTVAIIPVDADTYTVEVSGMTSNGTVIATILANVAVDAANNSNTASTSTDNTVTYDNSQPTVTINQAAGQVDPTNTSPIVFDVVFSESVTGFTAADVDLSASTAPGTLVASISGSGSTYTVSVSGMTGSGTVVASVLANAAVDAANNGNTASTSTDNTVTYDVTVPTVTINQAAGQVDPTNTSPIVFTVQFSEAVTDFDDPSDVTLSGTAGATTVVIIPVDADTYTVQVSGMASSGTVIASVNTGAAMDPAGNGNTASTSTDNQVTYDITVPTVTINQAAGQVDPTNMSPILFTVQFSEAVTDFDDPSDVMLSGTAGATTVVIIPVDADTYTVQVSGMTSDGTVIATVLANVAVDAANNSNTASTSTDNTVTYDNSQPTVTINQAAGQVDPTNTSPILFTVQFSEPVTDFDDPSDVTLSGTAGATTVVIIPVDADTYTVQVSGMTSDGTVIATVLANVAVDASNNSNTASTSTDNTVTYDVTVPTVTINQAAGQVDPTNTSPIVFTVQFSEAVTDFDDPSDVTLSGTAGATTVVIIPVDADTYTVQVSGMASSGTVIASVNTGAAMDPAGNGNTASTSTDNQVTYDITVPTVTINQGASQEDPTSLTPVVFDVVFSEPVTGFTNTDVDLTSTTAPGSLSVVVTPISATNYTVAISGMTGDGLIIVSIPADVAIDAANNSNTASTSTDNTVTYIFCAAEAGEIANSEESADALEVCIGSDPGFTFSAENEEVGANYLYAFLLVDVNGNIVQNNTSGDFDLSTLTVAASPYTVYGLSYANFNTPNTIAAYLAGKTITDIQTDDAGTVFCLELTGTPVNGQSNVIIVNPLPTGTFSISDDEICNGDEAFLQFQSTTGTPNFTITFGGGNINPGTTSSTVGNGNPFWTLTTQWYNVGSNTFTVTQIEDDNGCITTLNEEIELTVNPLPQGTLSGGTFCKGDDAFLYFTASVGTAPYSVVIDGLNNNQPIMAGAGNGNPIWTFVDGQGLSDGGNNFPLLSITDANGCTFTGNPINTAVIYVNAVYPGEVGNDQKVCLTKIPAALATKVAASSTATTNYQWEMSMTGCDGDFVPVTDEISMDENLVFTKPLKKTTYFRRRAISILNDVRCEAVSNCVTITVLNVDCGQFPWNGN